MLPAIVVLAVAAAGAAVTPQPPSSSAEPVIDVHLHAFAANAFGPPPAVTCAAPLIFLARDPKVPLGLNNIAGCETRLESPMTDEDLMTRTLAMMTRHHIVTAVVSGAPAVVRRWRAAAPDKVIPGVNTNGNATVDQIRGWVSDGTLRVLGELGFQYVGLAPTDPVPDSYFAVAEDLDLPVAVHLGPGAPGAAYLSFPKFEMSLGNPLLYERALVKHPKMRLYVMHAGWPMIDQMIALLYAHPQVYVDIGLIDWYIPRREFHAYLRRLVEAGFEQRIMFGSDQTMWPETIGIAIDAVQSAAFLSPAQKRGIFHENAARFFRLPASTGK
jgi:uncharacterized protein